MYNVEHAAELVTYSMALTDNGQRMPVYLYTPSRFPEQLETASAHYITGNGR